MKIKDSDSDRDDHLSEAKPELQKKGAKGHSKRPKYSKKDLPLWALKEDRWHHIVMPTLVSFLGNTNDPWTISDDVFLRVLQLIIDVVYHDIKADTKVTCPSPIFDLVSIHLSFGLYCETYSASW